jgi:hypothetical protein
MENTTEGEIVKLDTRGRVRLSQQRWDELLSEFERSGMSGEQFAKWAGIKYTTFAYRRQKKKQAARAIVAKPGAPAKPIKWVEAVVKPEKPRGLVIDLALGVRISIEDVSQARLAGVLLRELTTGASGC